MQVIPVIAGWIKSSILVDMNGYIENIWILLEALLNSIAFTQSFHKTSVFECWLTVVDIPRGNVSLPKGGLCSIWKTHQSSIRIFRHRAG